MKTNRSTCFFCEDRVPYQYGNLDRKDPQSTEFHLPTVSRWVSMIRQHPSRISVRPGVHLVGAGVLHQPTSFIFLRLAVQKFITTVPLRHLLIRPSVCSNHTTPTHLSANLNLAHVPIRKLLSSPPAFTVS
jgi:hypothetical protein